MIGKLASALAIAGLLVVAPQALAQPVAPLGHAGRWITDTSGRVVIMHGVNMVYKRAPYAPDAAGFSADDADFLAREGFNTVRLGTIYAAVEPQPGVYDDAYLDRIKATEQMLADHGIYSLIDFHQDLYNERFQGEGWPAWAVQDDGLPAQPQVGFPGNYLLMLALNRAFDHFWANDPGPRGIGLQDRYAAAWNHVAGRFADATHVMGYDPLNEPWPGSVYATCASPVGCPLFDLTQLSAFNNRVVSQIRQADTSHLVWPEPLLTHDFGANTWMSDSGDPNTGFNFHDYCLPGAFGVPTGDTCETFEDLPFQNADARAASTGDALLLSEFGATDDAATNLRLVKLADQHMVSWQFWHYCNCDDPTTQAAAGTQSIVNDPRNPPTGANVALGKLAVLVRPYPQAVAGTPQSYGFDPTARRFQLSYSTSRADGGGDFKTSGDPVPDTSPRTEVFIPDRQYPDGYVADVQGGAIASAPGARTLEVIACPGADNVTLTVLPAGTGSADTPDCRIGAAGGGGGGNGGAAGSAQTTELSVAVRPHRAQAGVKSCFRITVTSGGGQRVAGARVRLGGVARFTHAKGRRRICRRFDSPGTRTVRAGKAGFSPATAEIGVVG